MDVGVTIFPTDQAIDPIRLGPEVEARGFDSLFVAEHTHIPVSRRTPYPAGGELPEEYRRTHDPFVTLMAAAAVTSRLKVGTGICLVAQRDPIVLAKEVASLDRLSGGRFVFGVGYGWNVEEMQAHGVDPRRRRELVREKILAMKALWTQDEASFDGEQVHLAPSWCWPKPLQRPHPPLFVGGAAGPTLFRHIVEWADGWIPIGGSGLGENWPKLRQVAEDAGRDPATLKVIVFAARPNPESLEHYASLGVSSTVLGLPPGPAEVVLPLLDQWAPLVERVA
ncbi:MAG: LLM class F420-dependent oxidoreductase [Acidimicrobiales bacterium]